MTVTYRRRIATGPLGSVEIGPDERDRVEARAASLGVIVSTIGSGSRHRRWTVRVRRGDDVVAVEGYGSLVAMIDGALDDWQERYG